MDRAMCRLPHCGKRARRDMWPGGRPPPDGNPAAHDPAATIGDLAEAPTVELTLNRDLVAADLIPPAIAADFGGLPELLIEPAALRDSAVAIRPQFLLVSTNGDPVVVERVRTAIELVMPTSGPATGADLASELTQIVDELGRVVTLGVLLALIIAGCSLAVGVAGGLLDRRRPFALLRMSGVPLRHLQGVLVLEAAVPLVAVAAISGILGVVASQLALRMPGLHLSGTGGSSPPLPDASLLILVVGSVGMALAVAACVLPLVHPVTSLEETRFE
jgi:predicted lysophospholipase L1 biosynthesis ABC-type transport system permease subunit